MSIEETLRAFVVEDLSWRGPAELLADQSNLIDTGVIDSLGLLELVRFLEFHFGVDVNEEDVVPENFETFAAMAAYIQARQARPSE